MRQSVLAVNVDDHFAVATAVGLARQDEASHARVAARRRRPGGQHQQRAGHQPFALRATLTLRSLRTDFAARPRRTSRAGLTLRTLGTHLSLWSLRTCGTLRT